MKGALPELCLVDWGIGGFGVVRAIRARAPDLDLGYFSDSGTAPYGTLGERELRQRLAAVARALFERGVRHLVLACNAASTVATTASWPAGLRVTDVISHGVAVVARARVQEVGIVGGARTIRSHRHARALRAMGIRVHARVAQPLSAFVERGVLDGAEVEQVLARVVAPLTAMPALLLACTHYPALAPLFRRALPGVRLLDPADSIASEILRYRTPRSADAHEGTIVASTTGSPATTRRAARRAFGVDPGPVRQF